MSANGRKVLISGASFAGLSTAFWMSRLGYEVTVVEVARGLRTGGTAVDIKGNTVHIVRRMGLFEQIRSNRLSLRRWDLKNERDVTERSMVLREEGEAPSEDAFEIERTVLLNMLFDAVKDRIEVVFDDSITALSETKDSIEATFARGARRTFDLVFGCDGVHSAVRRLWFGDEARYLHFLEQYFSITIVDKLLIERNTAQMFNVPGKAVMLNAYKNNTDIIFAFASDKELPYDRRDEEAQRRIVVDRFAGTGWRTAELLEEVRGSKSFYFDKLCQIRMPSWTKGRVALVGDAGYCPSPAAGMGGSLAIDGAAALADAMREHDRDFELAFSAYDERFRPFVEQVQTEAVRTGLESLVPRTEEAIRARNARTDSAF
ncbi:MULTISPECIES: FAD-dependent monooxygenase [unclassified Corallococcus]|uniref:FAD-dependent monooxygenase n=1 Tax=unclassified Corallococcus TaxID=2685029 RepID=UPI001A8F6484|nr:MULTISPECIES: FAD-dependent monooxygenase [unclassified Corallococcus]MBN9686382.1 FAD-dependent monooxygenase [Corallococcus sp. NCSPR001]WAS82191.1 FAD-dependent monooxygenase [Corallococcus sp. NCRR]